ncbi:MAG: hypothetical protein IJF31_00340 [Clostridia bacterium]|nr:hypothetical protein [Clostridia bacterium]
MTPFCDSKDIQERSKSGKAHRKKAGKAVLAYGEIGFAEQRRTAPLIS